MLNILPTFSISIYPKAAAAAAVSDMADLGADYSRYTACVLQLAEEETEESVDAHLTQTAVECGLDISESQAEGVTSSDFSENARSGATSRNSRSTGLTSSATVENQPGSSGACAAAAASGLSAVARPTHLMRGRSLSFTEYESFLAQAQEHELKPARLPLVVPADPANAPSIFSVSTRKSLQSLKRGYARLRYGKHRAIAPHQTPTCVSCGNDLGRSKVQLELYTLPCTHNCCSNCLRVVLTQAINEDTMMPPRCCNTPIQSALVKSILDEDQQQMFLNSMLRVSTPTENRVYCPNPACGEFIPRRNHIDPKHPFELTCRDWELDAVLQIGQARRWRRCYKCLLLVESIEGHTHMTCSCEAEFCYICGGVWDATDGCPNLCDGPEATERRRVEAEEKRQAEELRLHQEELKAAASKALQQASNRSAQSAEILELLSDQNSELLRFLDFHRNEKRDLMDAHNNQKAEITQVHQKEVAEIKAKFATFTDELEDRQVSAEMELRHTLKQESKACQTRIRHMEIYCNGLNSQGEVPGRVVTERDLRQLGLQYNLRDEQQRLQSSRINVMRDKQNKQMEDYIAKHDEDVRRMRIRQVAIFVAFDMKCEGELRKFRARMHTRKERLVKRWELCQFILREKMAARDGHTYAPVPQPEWPEFEPKPPSRSDDGDLPLLSRNYDSDEDLGFFL
ncbi:MAG: hypothetical protein M1829_005519 [Trizodia sp. TS-e1964]|nr:MAG: hypothetical protein M1829_005519 [Trizodia sp. TS-e1964]